MVKAIVMAGGSGTRFWPLSRQHLPKQFLCLDGNRSLIQQTVDRIQPLVGLADVRIITNEKHRMRTREQLPDVHDDQIIAEPCGRDTAPCIALAAALSEQDEPGCSMIVLAADHRIQPAEKFREALATALEFIERSPESLVTFGILPNRPATGYGYLKRDELLSCHGDVAIYRLSAFHEKPDLAQAQAFLDDGRFFWNAGIFVWKARTILDELQRHAPAIAEQARRIADAWPSTNRDTVFRHEFERMPKISIDYAVMEKASNVRIVTSPFDWDDVGSWLALQRLRNSDESGNISIGDFTGIDCEGCVSVSEGGMVAALGVQDLIMVHTPDVTLVAHRDDEQRVKQLLAELERRGRQSVL